MQISFHGAAREVTGSCHLIEVNGKRILLDCGMIQGGRERHARNREPFRFNPADLDVVVLSHAHIDHSGRLPLLVQAGFRGQILATPATVDLARILLSDSARIHEEDARWKIKRLKKAGEDSSWVHPLFTEEDAAAVQERLVAVPFDRDRDLAGAGSVRFVKAGHILGAAIVEMTLNDEGVERRVVFSGDLGVEAARLLSAPKPVALPDVLLMESTYGDRSREETVERTEALHRVLERTLARGGRLIIPAFAVGRAQEILARINDLVESGRLSGVPVYVDSPMAVAATRVFESHPEAFSEEARRLLHAGDEPLDFPGLRLVTTVEDSREINRSRTPAVIISASGMCTAGRIKHHLKHNISDSRCTVLFVGYQARGTLGQVIQSGTSPVRIFGDRYPVACEVVTIEGFSAHADREELVQWFESLGGAPSATFVVHGEENAAGNLATLLRNRFRARVDVPELGQEVVIP
jgi:metallo-beta-lactamase family protein